MRISSPGEQRSFGIELVKYGSTSKIEFRLVKSWSVDAFYEHGERNPEAWSQRRQIGASGRATNDDERYQPANSSVLSRPKHE